jgi:hypothetical protein
MKHKSIFTIFAALTMVFGFAMTGLGQQTGNISANATVLGALSVGSVRPLNFGNVSLAGPKTIDLAGAATGAGSAGGDFNQGTFSITKSTGTPVDFTFTVLPSTLITDGGTLPIATYLAGWNANSLSGGTSTPASTAFNAITTIPSGNTDPIIYVHIGATVTPADPATIVGIYTGTLTLRAEYN